MRRDNMSKYEKIFESERIYYTKITKDFLDSFDTILEVLLKHYDVAHNKNYEDFKNFIIVETGLQGKYLFKPL